MLIPIGDDNARRLRTPIITPLIAGACLGVWLLQLSRGDAFTMAWAATPEEITSGRDLIGTQLVRAGDQLVPIPHEPGPWPIQLTLLSSMFMHGSWGHLIGNLLYLMIFADQIEDRLGRFRYLLFYILCGIAAGVAQICWDPHSVVPTLGASGAIAGALGAYLVTNAFNRVRVLFFVSVFSLPAWVVLGGWFALQIWSQWSITVPGAGGVAYLAHIGGFVAGVVLVFLLTPRQPAR